MSKIFFRQTSRHICKIIMGGGLNEKRNDSASRVG